MKSMTGSIFLIGPMGAGKSTIGRRLADALGLEFIDSDCEIERRTGASIPLIFELEGEQGFRCREKAVIDDLTQRADIVLATGGGAVLDPDNRQALSARGFVVYLATSVNEQVRRTRNDSNRPLLQGGDPHIRLGKLLEIRDPLYRETADLIIDTNGRHARQVTRTLLNHIRPEASSCKP